jgi:hypothetical protein
VIVIDPIGITKPEQGGNGLWRRHRCMAVNISDGEALPYLAGSYRSPDTTDRDGRRATQDSFSTLLVETTTNGGTACVFFFSCPRRAASLGRKKMAER